MRANWGHSSAQKLKGAVADSDWVDMHFATQAAGVLEKLEVRRGFYKAPHVDLLFLHGLIASHAMGVSIKYSSLMPARSGDPQEAWDALCFRVLGFLVDLQASR